MSDYQTTTPLLPHYTAGGSEELSSESPRMQRAKQAAKYAIPMAIAAALVFGGVHMYQSSASATTENMTSSASSTAHTASGFGPSEANDQPLITPELLKHIKTSQSYWKPVESEHESPFKEWTLGRFRKLTKKNENMFDYVPDPRNLADEGTTKHPAPIKRMSYPLSPFCFSFQFSRVRVSFSRARVCAWSAGLVCA